MSIMAASLGFSRHLLRRVFLKVNIQHDSFVLFSSVVARDLNVAKTDTQSQEVPEEIIEYPTVKPRHPPGKWAEMEAGYAWLWQKTIDDLDQIPDIKGRQDFIIQNEMSHFNTLPFRVHPNYLEFAKYATKSALYPWLEVEAMEPFSSLSDNELFLTNNKDSEPLKENIKRMMIDQILIEHDVVERESYGNGTSFLRMKQSGLIMRSVCDTLITNLGLQSNHLRKCQYDENVTVRAVWDRHGIERKRKHRLSPSYYKVEEVLDHRLMSSCIFDGMIRSHLPLPQLQPRDGGLSIESEKPLLRYKPSSYGVTKMAPQKSKSILAGHNLGDPCEYGLVGYLLTNKMRRLDEKFGSKIAKECRLGYGLTSTFTWLAAQAYNQGFSGFTDLTYPLTSQTILSDGQNFSFLACQLNTLELWKSDHANDIVNLCWYSDEMPLYECVENGQVKGFNDDLLNMLIKVFLLEPAERGYDMKSAVTEKDINLHQKTDFIPERVDVVMKEEEEQYII